MTARDTAVNPLNTCSWNYRLPLRQGSPRRWTSHNGAQTQVREQEAITTCGMLYPTNSFPREVAGADIDSDIVKCQLKPLTPSDYSVAFTPAQWARLQAIFRAACGTGPIPASSSRPSSALACSSNKGAGVPTPGPS